MKVLSKWLLVIVLVPHGFAQTSVKPKARKAPPTEVVTAGDIQALKDALAAQQQQIQQLQQALAQRDQAVQAAQQQAQQAQTAASDAQQKAASVEAIAGGQKDSYTKLDSDLADVKTTMQN